jgi:hypothetical protein
MKPTHDALWAIVRQLPEDYWPYGQNRDREGDPSVAPSQVSDAECAASREREQGVYNGDCSCGCRFFAKLDGAIGMDWGICFNPKSHRVGLLTFEHQGCDKFAGDDADEPTNFP